MFDIDKPISAAKLARLLACGNRHVFTLKDRDIAVAHEDGRGFDGLESTRRYIAHLRDTAAGREATAQPIDIKLETVRLEAEQRRNYELKNAALEGKLVPYESLTSAWWRVIRAGRAAVLAIPGRARFAIPHLTVYDGQKLEEICRDALETAAIGDDPPPADKDSAHIERETI